MGGMSRTATLSRKTSESSIELSLDLDGTGASTVATTVPMVMRIISEGTRRDQSSVTR